MNGSLPGTNGRKTTQQARADILIKLVLERKVFISFIQKEGKRNKCLRLPSAPALWSKKTVYAPLVESTIATMTSPFEISQATHLRDKFI
jgi:hypothetical protein